MDSIDLLASTQIRTNYTGNPMQYYISDTESAANTLASAIFNSYVNQLPDGSTLYLETTECWSVPTPRLIDSKWVFEECPHIDNSGYTLEEVDTGGTWFAVFEGT